MFTWVLPEIPPRSSSDALAALFRAHASIMADRHTSLYKKRWLGGFFPVLLLMPRRLKKKIKKKNRLASLCSNQSQ